MECWHCGLFYNLDQIVKNLSEFEAFFLFVSFIFCYVYLDLFQFVYGRFSSKPIFKFFSTFFFIVVQVQLSPFYTHHSSYPTLPPSLPPTLGVPTSHP